MPKLFDKNIKRKNSFMHLSPYLMLIFILSFLLPSTSFAVTPRYIILMIADGCGVKHIEATNVYTGSVPAYQTDPNWVKHWVSTYPSGGSYNGFLYWDTNFNYVLAPASVTDSAASATALYTGNKTANSRICVSAGVGTRLYNLGEKAKDNCIASGAITTVPLSHATPGAWTSHNDNRANGYAIADEGLFEDPNTTGNSVEPLYAGGHGPTIPRTDVVIGDGFNASYVNTAIRNMLSSENGNPGKHDLVQWLSGQNGANNLINKANNTNVTRLAGLFKHVYHKANGSGFDSQNPTLADSTNAALKVLSRNPNGFVLMIEGGAVDWAGHTNIMDDMIGEKKDFDAAVQAVIDWVNNTPN
ncbi:MAG: alkaline phosphatase, partial [Candidatus Scalindua sp.]|nr:alkaline phosphatase [Candidatus Scalindua sp.]